MTPERSAGGIVLGDGGTVAMVLSRNSRSWLFPKGYVEAGESDEEAARREIAEEAGLADLEYLDDLGAFTRPPAAGYAEKTVRMFLFAAPGGAALAPTREIEEAAWVPYRQVSERLGEPHPEWFTKDRAWFASVFDRVSEAVRRD